MVCAGFEDTPLCDVDVDNCAMFHDVQEVIGKSAETYKSASQRDVKITIDQENFLPLDSYGDFVFSRYGITNT